MCGNLVAATPSGGGCRAAGHRGTRFGLGRGPQMFNLDEGHPNALQGWPSGQGRPSARTSSSAGRAWLAFGTPAGISRTSGPSFFLAHHRRGLNRGAIDAPMFHSSTSRAPSIRTSPIRGRSRRRKPTRAGNRPRLPCRGPRFSFSTAPGRSAGWPSPEGSENRAADGGSQPTRMQATQSAASFSPMGQLLRRGQTMAQVNQDNALEADASRPDACVARGA